MRTFLLPLLALAALALAAPGLAKEPKSATVCGPDGCATTNDSRQLLNLIADNGTTPPPPPAGEYYKVTMTIDVPPDAGVAPKVEWWYTASGGGLLRAVQKDPSGVTAWYPLTATGTAFMERLTRDVKPFPLPRVTSATIGGKPVADPSSYLALFGQETTGSARVAAGDWQDIVFSGPASPWTDNAVTLQYSPSADAILRGYEIAKLPPSLAAKVESGSSLAPGSSFRWWLVGLAALVLAAAAAVVALRRLPRGRALAKRLALPLFLLGALALAPAALAKEPKQATVCGPEGCATTTDGRALTSFVTRSDTGPPPPPGAYYRMTVTIDVPPDAGSAPTFDWWYVPSANMVYRTGIFGEGQENWVRPTPAAARLLERTVRDLAPFPTPEPTRVVVGGRTVDDPASYLRLFTQGSVGHRIPSAGDWQTIRFFGPNSPWTDGSLALSYSKHDGLLLRGGEVITLPTSLVDRIAAGSSLGGTGRTLPWTLLAAVAVALALVASGLLALRRRSPRGLQRPFGRPAGSAG